MSEAAQPDANRPTGSGAQTDEWAMIAALRNGEEAAFTALVNRYHATMIRLAMIYVSDRSVAEEVAQEAWMGILRSLDNFEGRSSLKTWMFRILTNRAKTRATREGRSIAFSDLWSIDQEPDEPVLEPERFLPSDHAQWPHHWATPPQSWAAVPEERMLSQETRALVQGAINTLPMSQRMVISLRDIAGWTSEEVCNVLNITESNQRVLLHRARAKVRRALERYLNEA